MAEFLKIPNGRAWHRVMKVDPKTRSRESWCGIEATPITAEFQEEPNGRRCHRCEEYLANSRKFPPLGGANVEHPRA